MIYLGSRLKGHWCCRNEFLGAVTHPPYLTREPGTQRLPQTDSFFWKDLSPDLIPILICSCICICTFLYGFQHPRKLLFEKIQHQNTQNYQLLFILLKRISLWRTLVYCRPRIRGTLYPEILFRNLFTWYLYL